MPKILFIEDESALQKTLANAFQKEGPDFQVVSALNGEEGLALAKKESPDIILLDLILPKKNGFEVLKEIKQDPETRDIPLIVLTNMGRMQDIEKALELGARQYLIKSDQTLKDIVDKVKNLLQISSQKGAEI